MSRSLPINTLFPYTTLFRSSHTVELSGIAANCTVSGQNPRTVTVPTSGTTTTFSITCTALTGHLTDITSTSGAAQPSRYPVGVTGGGSERHGRSGSVTSSSGTTTTFSITCTALTGNLTVSTSTSGDDQPSSYTVSVTGGGSQPIGATGSVTFTGLTTGSHTVTLSGVPTNCSVSGGTSHPANVPAGSTGSTSFSISCVATTGSLDVTTTTSGGTPDPDGYTVSVNGGGGASQHIDPNASLTFFNLAVGSH